MLSQAEYERRNVLLTDQLKIFLLQNDFQNIHIFLPIHKNKEPDTFLFIEYIWKNHPRIQIVTSISDIQHPEMHHYKIDESISITPNKWSIPEPQEAQLFPVDEIQAILVPMTIGSKSGHRIGYGKGYYDRFLSQCSEAIFVGVSLAPFLDGDIFAESFDQPLDFMINPFEIIECVV